MKARKMARLLEAARRDATRQNFRETFEAPNGRSILCESKQEYDWWDQFTQALADKAIRPAECSIRDLFESFVEDGASIVRTWSPKNEGSKVQLHEADVDTATFSNISGQITYSTIMEEWQSPEFLVDKLTTNQPTEFDGEKIAGIGGLGDGAEEIGEGKLYPLIGPTEDWIETPQTTKRGFIVPVTKEAIFFDRTGQLLARVKDTVRWLRVNKEKRGLDAIFGITNSYKRKGVAIDTYQASTPYINIKSSNALADWTDIEAALLLFDAMTDPNTGEPIAPQAIQVIVPTALLFTARRIINATEIRFGDGASATTQTISANPATGFSIESSPYVKARTSSDTTWFIGDSRKAVKYMENWPITTTQAPVNNHDEFHRDIVHQEKISERGVFAVVEPRHLVKNTSG